ncbi:MAG: hypothetical protein LLF75_04060 [Eubacteriales bacterium]|nr:hypothetical protein [Eubacteriales bacterium]
MNIAIYVCLGCMLVFGVFSAASRKLIISAVALAVVSAALGVLMYVLGAHTAAIFEVSVCSGLVTVIFISAVSLSNGDKQIEAQDVAVPARKRRFLPAILIGAGAILMIVAWLTGFSVGTPAAAVSGANFNDVFWETCQADIFGQMVALIAGASAIVVFFKESENE